MVWSFTTMGVMFFTATTITLAVLMVVHLNHEKNSKAKKAQDKLKKAIEAGIEASK